jgi:hypothetical protein
MKDTITARFNSLVVEGEYLVLRLPRDQDGYAFYASSSSAPQYSAWLHGTANLVRSIAPPKSHYPDQIDKILQHEAMQHGIVSSVVQQVHGVLLAAKADWESGLLRSIEFVLAAATFDDFLDHAEFYHKGGKKVECSVLASAVLEDVVKKIAKKNGIDAAGQSLEQIVDFLTGAQALSPVKAKRIKSWAAVRNSALHAEWDKFDIKDAGMMIAGIRELVSDHL